MASVAAPATAGKDPGKAPPAKFVQGNLFRHVAVMALTSSVGLMAIFIVDLINMVYISWMQDPEATAAIGYAGAALFFTSGFGIGLSIGVSALVAQAVGARDTGLARARATSGLILGAVLGAAFSAAMWILTPQMVAAFGATGGTAEKTISFMRLVLPSQPLLMIGMIGSGILRSHGDAKRAMWVTVWGAIVLAALDPVFILWADWGLTGAAVAGWGSRLVIAGMALWPIWRHYGGFVRVTPAMLRLDAGPLLTISGPAVMTQLATPAGQAIVTRLVSGFGEPAVAGMAITGRLAPVAFAIIFALAGAVGPIIGQNLGAGRLDRVRRTLRESVLFCGLVIVVMSAALFLLRAPLADLFHATGETREILYLFCGPLSLLFFFNGLIFIANAACNNLGAAYQATMINWARHTLGTLPFAWALAGIWGAKGVLVGQAVGGVIFGLLALWLAMRIVARREAALRPPRRRNLT